MSDLEKRDLFLARLFSWTLLIGALATIVTWIFFLKETTLEFRLLLVFATISSFAFWWFFEDTSKLENPI